MLVAQQSGLVVVDVQGTLAKIVDNSQMTIANTVKLIKCCQALSIPVVVLEQNPQGLGPTLPVIQEAVGSSLTFEKFTFNGMDTAEIKQQIVGANKTSWLVAGIEAHICVYQTVRGLLDQGLHVEVVTDCISSRLRSNVELAIENMRHFGANITSLEMCVYQMLGSSQSDEFKKVLSIVK